MVNILQAVTVRFNDVDSFEALVGRLQFLDMGDGQPGQPLNKGNHQEQSSFTIIYHQTSVILPSNMLISPYHPCKHENERSSKRDFERPTGHRYWELFGAGDAEFYGSKPREG